MNTKEITFISPKHSYAEKEWLWQIYLSPAVLSMKARLADALGEETKIKYIDENMSDVDYKNLKWIVWISLLWSPYIPVALDMIKKIPEDVTILLWWQIISCLSVEEFQKIFCKYRKNVFNWNDVKNLEEIFSLKEGSIPNLENADLTKAYQDIPDNQMKEYLKREFCLYLSQWCKYNCSFCQAVKGTNEKYRDLSLLEKDLNYLWNKAKKFGLKKIEFYLSNLDLLQTPDMFENFLDSIEKTKNNCPWIDFKFRALCWIESFLKLYNEKKSVLERAKKLWLSSLWYGVDWATAEVWKSIWKSHNFKKIWNEKDFQTEQEKAIETIRLTHELWITPEVLMVFWHPWETESSLKAAYDFCKDMYERYWATPRPHISKTIIPWTKARSEQENKDIVNEFIENPEYFQALDYTALPSELTHPDEKLRRIARKRYIKICKLTDESTKYIIPETEHYKKIAKRVWTTVSKMNEWKFDR